MFYALESLATQNTCSRLVELGGLIHITQFFKLRPRANARFHLAWIARIALVALASLASLAISSACVLALLTIDKITIRYWYL